MGILTLIAVVVFAVDNVRTKRRLRRTEQDLRTARDIIDRNRLVSDARHQLHMSHIDELRNIAIIAGREIDSLFQVAEDAQRWATAQSAQGA